MRYRNIGTGAAGDKRGFSIASNVKSCHWAALHVSAVRVPRPSALRVGNPSITMAVPPSPHELETNLKAIIVSAPGGLDRIERAELTDPGAPGPVCLESRK